jgi:hypothetical protein
MEPRAGTDGLAADLERQRAAIGERVPVYGELLRLAAELLDDEPGARLAQAWGARRFFAFYDRPLLLLTAIRADALAEGPAHLLWEAIAAERPRVEAATLDGLRAALAPERARVWRALAARIVQTNETTRAVAWRWPAFLAGSRPIALVDLGCSAGLNLVAGALPAMWTAGGAPLPVAGDDRVVARVGIDANPLDVRSDDDAAWLRAAVWPGDPARAARLDAAIAAMRATHGPTAPELIASPLAGAPEVLAKVAARVPPRTLILAYQTIVREYLSDPDRVAHEEGMRSFLRSVRPGDAVWVELELDRRGGRGGYLAALDAHHAGGTLRLAHCDFHPRELLVDENAARELAALL